MRAQFKHLFFFLLAFTVAALVCLASSASADTQKIDDLLKELDKKPVVPPTLTLDLCIAITLENNPELLEKLTALNTVEADVLIDKSRFFSHVDVLASFTKQDGSLLKSYYPNLNPQPVSSFGSVSLGATSLSSASSGSSGISASDIQSLTGMSTSDLAGLASQYGVDISKFGLKSAGGGAVSSPAEKTMAEKTIMGSVQRPAGLTVTVDNPVIGSTDVTVPDDQLQALLANSVTGGDSSSANKYTDSHIGVRYSRRLMEWGKDPISQVGIRSNRRSAIFNYQQKLRDVLSELRKTFFLVLLKKKQIEERSALREAYEKKLREQQLRYEVAKDVPMIDVLTAELDVLNEKLRINTLRNAMINNKLKLLKLMGKPIGANFDVSGDPPDLKNFEFGVDNIVSLTKENSYQVSYMKQEIAESERELGDIKRDYKPKYTAKAGFENHRSDMGFTLNSSDNTYGIDFGAEQHLNLGRDSSSAASSLLSGGSHNKDDNFYLNFGVTYLVNDNMKREGVTKKQLESLNKLKAQLAQQELEEELQSRQAWQGLQEAVEQLSLQEDTLKVSERRLEITRKLKEIGKVQEFQVDNYRNQFFSDQDRLFTAQENVITAQENLRKIMGVFY